jgi:hypothetical protein
MSIARTIVGSNTPVQEREPIYPPKVNLPKFSHPIARLEENPFPYEKAEEDTPYLFAEEKALFWSEHPLSKTLGDSCGATLVTGEAGSGKTALALALGEYRFVVNKHTTFSCYISGTPRLDEIYENLARSLLSFIKRLPSFLILLGEERRHLLAQVLLNKFDKNLVLGQLEQASQTNKWKWLGRAGDDETKRKIWEAEACTHIKLLSDAVAVSAPCTYSDYQWMVAFMACIRSLEFEKSAYIAIDAGSDFTWGWYSETILRQQHRWREINLHTVTFHTPRRLHKKQIENEWLNRFELKWDEEQLKAMIQWRWDNIYRRRPFATLFAQNASQRIILSSALNPRCFIQLWNGVFQNEPIIPITEEEVERAKERLP